MSINYTNLSSDLPWYKDSTTIVHTSRFFAIREQRQLTVRLGLWLGIGLENKTKSSSFYWVSLKRAGTTPGHLVYSLVSHQVDGLGAITVSDVGMP